MDEAQWLHAQLLNSAEAFAWAVAQVPAERRRERPPPALGDWSAARHAFHLVYYERAIALPSMRQWVGGTRLPEVHLSEDHAWARADPAHDLLAELQGLRREQTALLNEIAPEAWERVRGTLWGPVALRWVVTKTYQHTAEHTHDVLSLALFWDMALGHARPRPR